MKHALIIGILLTSITAPAQEHHTAKIFELDHTDAPPIFVQKIKIERFVQKIKIERFVQEIKIERSVQEIKIERSVQKIQTEATPATPSPDSAPPPAASASVVETRTSTIVDADGKIVMTEVAIYEDARLISQDVHQKQSGLSYEVRVTGDRVTFREFKDDGTSRTLVKEKSETPDGDLVTGPTTGNYIRAHWNELMKGDRVSARFGVLELGETVGFVFKQKKLLAVDGREVLVLEMKPSHFFISLMVAPMTLEFDVVKKNLIRYRGRTPLSQKVDGKSKPFDAEIIYQ